MPQWGGSRITKQCLFHHHQWGEGASDRAHEDHTTIFISSSPVGGRASDRAHGEDLMEIVLMEIVLEIPP